MTTKKATSAGLNSIDLFKSAVFEVCPDFQTSNANRDLLNNLYRYCNKQPGELDPSKGILLWGSIGTGKSTLLKILNKYDYKINPERHVQVSGRWSYVSGGFKIIDCATVANIYAKNGIDGLDYYTYNNGEPITVGFDELGREPLNSKSFGTEMNVMQYILQIRYGYKDFCKTHITTNLNPDEGIAKLYDKYVADRVKEMFNIINLNGKSWRK